MASALERNLYVIGAIIYVAGMFVIYYFYQFQGLVNPGYIALISIVGAFLVLSQAFFGSFDNGHGQKPAKS